jgi:hypothetical protein
MEIIEVITCVVSKGRCRILVKYITAFEMDTAGVDKPHNVAMSLEWGGLRL